MRKLRTTVVLLAVTCALSMGGGAPSLAQPSSASLSPPLRPGEVVVRSADGCGFVVGAAAAEQSRNYLGQAEWTGDCAAGLAHGWGSLSQGELSWRHQVQYHHGYPMSVGRAAHGLLNMAPQITASVGSRRVSLSEGPLRWGFSLGEHDQLPEPLTDVRGPDGTSVETFKKYCGVLPDVPGGCRNRTFIYGVTRHVNGRDRVYYYCPDPTTSAGCETLWNQHAADVLQAVTQVINEARASDDALVAELDARFQRYAERWTAANPHFAQERSDAQARLAAARAASPYRQALAAGDAALARGDNAGALANYQAAQRLNGGAFASDPDAKNNEGVALLRSGNLTMAQLAFQHALVSDPYSPQARANLSAAGAAIVAEANAREERQRAEAETASRREWAEALNILGAALNAYAQVQSAANTSAPQSSAPSVGAMQGAPSATPVAAADPRTTHNPQNVGTNCITIVPTRVDTTEFRNDCPWPVAFMSTVGLRGGEGYGPGETTYRLADEAVVLACRSNVREGAGISGNICTGPSPIDQGRTSLGN